MIESILMIVVTLIGSNQSTVKPVNNDNRQSIKFVVVVCHKN